MKHPQYQCTDVLDHGVANFRIPEGTVIECQCGDFYEFRKWKTFYGLASGQAYSYRKWKRLRSPKRVNGQIDFNGRARQFDVPLELS